MADERTYDYKGVRLNFSESGSGSETMLTFHGFGQNASVFNELAGALSQKYRIFSFSLFYHGSIWPYEDRPLTPEFLNEIVESFLKSKQIGRFSMIAYSIGVRISLVLAEKQAERIDRLILIAPDGIRPNFWYKLATGTWMTRYIFRYSVNSTGFLVGLAKWAAKLGMIHSSIARFAHSQVGLKEKREKVYHTWMMMRKLKIRLRILAGILNHSQVKTIVFLGMRDRIITEAHVRPLTARLEKCEIIKLPSNHQRLIAGVMNWVNEHPESI